MLNLNTKVCFVTMVALFLGCFLQQIALFLGCFLQQIASVFWLVT